jgi:hypothetical protein
MEPKTYQHANCVAASVKLIQRGKNGKVTYSKRIRFEGGAISGTSPKFRPGRVTLTEERDIELLEKHKDFGRLFHEVKPKEPITIEKKDPVKNTEHHAQQMINKSNDAVGNKFVFKKNLNKDKAEKKEEKPVIEIVNELLELEGEEAKAKIDELAEKSKSEQLTDNEVEFLKANGYGVAETENGGEGGQSEDGGSKDPVTYEEVTTVKEAIVILKQNHNASAGQVNNRAGVLEFAGNAGVLFPNLPLE